jgi:hypothetical protein
MTSEIVGLRASIAKLYGELDNPRTVWLSDSQFNWVSGSPGDFGVGPGEQFVSIAGGKMEHALAFLRKRQGRLQMVETIVIHREKIYVNLPTSTDLAALNFRNF